MSFTSTLIAKFQENANLEYAKAMEAYMKNHFAFFGIKSPLRKQLCIEHLQESGVPYEGVEIAKELFFQPQRELHYVAQELLMKCKKQWQEHHIEDIEWFITTNSWWDSVDYLASNVVGEYFKKWPENKIDVVSYWNASDNMWLIRTSIIFQLKYKAEVDTQLLGDCILAHAHSKEFFIKKAIGWSLRQYSKYNPEWVKSFVAQNDLQPLSVKEALRAMH